MRIKAICFVFNVFCFQVSSFKFSLKNASYRNVKVNFRLIILWKKGKPWVRNLRVLLLTFTHKNESNRKYTTVRIFVFLFSLHLSFRVQNKLLQPQTVTLAPFSRRSSLSALPMPIAAPVTTALLPVRAISRSRRGPVRFCRKWKFHAETFVTTRSHPLVRVPACRILRSHTANTCFCVRSSSWGKRGQSMFVPHCTDCLSGSADKRKLQ